MWYVAQLARKNKSKFELKYTRINGGYLFLRVSAAYIVIDYIHLTNTNTNTVKENWYNAKWPSVCAPSCCAFNVL